MTCTGLNPKKRTLPAILNRIMAMALALFWLQTPAQAQARDDLIAKAKKEKEVVYYTELIVDQIVRPLAAAFEKTYGIKVAFWRADSQQVSLKLSVEQKAGRMQADVWSSASGLASLIEGRIIAPFSTENMAALPPEFRDRNGYWAATNVIVLGTALNTNLVPAAERPRSYDDLLDPRWRGRLVWKPNDLTGAWGFIGNALTLMGEEKGRHYLSRLNEQNVATMGASTRAILDHVAAGEFPVVLGVSDHNAEIARQNGAPVVWLPLDAAWAMLHTVGVTAGGPHPNAARLFVDFALSRQGQEIFRDAGYLPVRPDTPAAKASLRPEVSGFRATVFAPEDIERNLARWSSIYTTIFRR